MVSYTTSNRLAKIADGELQHAWGTPERAARDMLDEALDGIVAFTGTKTLTTANNATDEARKRVLRITGSAGGTVTLPDVAKWYILDNAATSAVTIRPTGAGTQLTIPAGMDGIVIHDGTNCYFVRSDFGWKLISTTTTTSGTTQTITINRTGFFGQFMMTFNGVRHDGAGGALQTLHVDFVRSTGTYPGGTTVIGPNAAAATDFYGGLVIHDQIEGSSYTGVATGALTTGIAHTGTTASAIANSYPIALDWGGTGVQFRWNSGAAFTGGSIELWGK